jgi:hypothetical protein
VSIKIIHLQILSAVFGICFQRLVNGFESKSQRPEIGPERIVSLRMGRERLTFDKNFWHFNGILAPWCTRPEGGGVDTIIDQFSAASIPVKPTVTKMDGGKTCFRIQKFD